MTSSHAREGPSPHSEGLSTLVFKETTKAPRFSYSICNWFRRWLSWDLMRQKERHFFVCGLWLKFWYKVNITIDKDCLWIVLTRHFYPVATNLHAHRTHSNDVMLCEFTENMEVAVQQNLEVLAEKYFFWVWNFTKK